MNIVSIIYGLGITIALTTAIVFFVRAFHRATGRDVAKDARSAEVQGVLDDRDRLLLNLQELDFDLAMKKIAKEDHTELRARLRTQLADVVRQLEEMGVDPETASGSESLR